MLAQHTLMCDMSMCNYVLCYGVLVCCCVGVTVPPMRMKVCNVCRLLAKLLRTYLGLTNTKQTLNSPQLTKIQSAN